MNRLQRLRPVAQACKARRAPQRTTNPSHHRTFTTTPSIRADDFEAEEPPSSQPRRSATEKRSLQSDAMSLIQDLDDQSLTSFDGESDLPPPPSNTSPARRASRPRRDEAPDLNVGSQPLRPRQMRPKAQRAPQGPQRRQRRGGDMMGISEIEGGDSAVRGPKHEDDDGRHYAGSYIDQYEDQFVSEPEQRGYEDVLQRTMDLIVQKNKVEDVQNKPEVKANPQGEQARRCEEEMRKVDVGIKEALDAMQRMRDKAYVPHKPEGVDIKQMYRSQTGAAGAGDGGIGNTMEDSLRYLGEREGHKWRDPRLLAKRLASGEFIKFKSHVERRMVMGALQDVANEEKKPELRKVKFQPLEPSARKQMAQRAVLGRPAGLGRQGGQLVEAGKMKGPQDVLDTAQRLTGGHYRGGQVETVLKAIGELLPQERAQQQGQARR